MAAALKHAPLTNHTTFRNAAVCKQGRAAVPHVSVDAVTVPESRC